MNLHQCIRANDWDGFEKALRGGMDPNARYTFEGAEHPLSPLQALAVHGRDVRFVKALLDAGADIYYTGQAGRTAEQLALERRRRVEAVPEYKDVSMDERLAARYIWRKLREIRARDVLYATPPELGLRDGYGNTALHWAARENDAGRVRRFMALGASPRERDHAGWTPLHEAAAAGAEEAVASLLAEDPQLNWQWDEKKGTLPLHAAIDNRQAGVLRRLLEEDARQGRALAGLCAQPSDGMHALDFSVVDPHGAAVEFVRPWFAAVLGITESPGSDELAGLQRAENGGRPVDVAVLLGVDIDPFGPGFEDQSGQARTAHAGFDVVGIVDRRCEMGIQRQGRF